MRAQVVGPVVPQSTRYTHHSPARKTVTQIAKQSELRVDLSCLPDELFSLAFIIVVDSPYGDTKAMETAFSDMMERGGVKFELLD